MKNAWRLQILLLIGFSWLAFLTIQHHSKSVVANEQQLNNSVASIATQPLTEAARADLQTVIQIAYLSDLHRPSFKRFQKDVADFYATTGDRLPWLDNGKPTAQARAIIAALKDAGYEGLSPEDYDASAWDQRVARLDSRSGVSDTELVRFDIALSVSTIRYISDLHLGRVNPNLYHSSLDVGSTTFSLAHFLEEKLVASDDVPGALKSLEPSIPPYQRTLAALRRYIELAHANNWQPLPITKKPVKPDDEYDAVPQLAQLLTLLGDLPQSAQALQTKRYSGDLVNAVKRFQDRHGLASNGQLDAATFAELNTPLSVRVTQLQLALERWRWLPHQFARPPIVVNIPEFRLHAIDDQNQSAFVMKIVVGKALGHETPVLASAIDAVIFRPEWNVPYSIQAKELIPDIKRKPGYLAKNSYEIVDHKGNVVSESDVSPEMLKELRSGQFAIRQKPGPNNSLGLIKFELPNQYDVYLHGTPAMSLFTITRRDFSHGCIRVEDPQKLAEWVLKDMPEWTPEKIGAAMDGDETVRVKVAQPVPVLVLYTTALASPDGEVRFFNDVYGLDAKLAEELAHAYDWPQ